MRQGLAASLVGTGGGEADEGRRSGCRESPGFKFVKYIFNTKCPNLLDAVPTAPTPAPMDLRNALDAYLAHLRNERALAPRTVEAYRLELERLIARLEESGVTLPASVDSYILKDYVASLKEESNLGPAATGRTVSTIRGFFRWLFDEGRIDPDPSVKLRRPKRGRKLPIHLGPVDAARLLALPREPDDPLAARNHVLFLLLVLAGLRVSECVGLRVSDIDFEGYTIRILGKGMKERLVPMGDALAETLRRWVAERPNAALGSDALFSGRQGGPMTVRMAQYAVEKAVKRLGLDPRISPHKLRHTFATLLYADGVALRDLQELLGHANLATTSIYTHTNVDRVRAAVETLRLGQGAADGGRSDRNTGSAS